MPVSLRDHSLRLFRFPITSRISRPETSARSSASSAKSSPAAQMPHSPDTQGPGGRRRQRLSVVVFSSAVFLSAALLFLLEPMFAKIVLPLLGGSAAVWTTCIVFFQVTLLAGYGYAHVLAKLSSERPQMAVHALVLFAPYCCSRIYRPGGRRRFAPSRGMAADASHVSRGTTTFRFIWHNASSAKVVRPLRPSVVEGPVLPLCCKQLRKPAGTPQLPVVDRAFLAIERPEPKLGLRLRLVSAVDGWMCFAGLAPSPHGLDPDKRSTRCNGRWNHYGGRG